ncbi:hypothetical protein FIBSPDRAFT_396244 [Athelia psychrophila]|uniref:Uncharacterized protein n=1 Tax=Athelia psychrophila TaxID=1759441 RepID=A0A166NNZ2_9AGAM|nr:hypothetical protein FIBSPDRAFT_396244 [Fibularhizoctonia sp. CBS 109695]
MSSSQKAGHARFVRIKHSLENIEVQRAALDSQERALKPEANDITNSVAPVSSIPNEVLAAIFEAGHSIDSIQDYWPFELAVSAVTSHWREVALRTPRLWTRIKRGPYQEDLTGIAVYLDRSKTISFHLIIDIGIPPLDRDLQPVREFDDVSACCVLLAPHMSRCNRMELSFLAKPGNGWPNLGHLGHQSHDILLRHFNSLPAPRSIAIAAAVPLRRPIGNLRLFAEGTPLVEHLSLCGVRLDAGIPPLSYIQSIHLHHPSSHSLPTGQEFCDMLAAATSLLHLRVVGEIVAWWTGAFNVTVPSLRTLVIASSRANERAGPQNQICGLLDTITAPSLELLLMRSCTARDFPPAMLQVSKFPCLKWLILEDVLFLPSEIIGAFNSVQYLVFDGNPDNLLDAHLAWPCVRTIALPHWHGNLDAIGGLFNECTALGHPLQRVFSPARPLPTIDLHSSLLLEEYDGDVAYARLPSQFLQLPRNLRGYCAPPRSDSESSIHSD